VDSPLVWGDFGRVSAGNGYNYGLWLQVSSTATVAKHSAMGGLAVHRLSIHGALSVYGSYPLAYDGLQNFVSFFNGVFY
jgi:hypothetical protein